VFPKTNSDWKRQRLLTTKEDEEELRRAHDKIAQLQKERAQESQQHAHHAQLLQEQCQALQRQLQQQSGGAYGGPWADLLD
jgi:hypothetical protein